MEWCCDALTTSGARTAGGWQKDLKHGLGRKMYSTGDVYEVRYAAVAEMQIRQLSFPTQPQRLSCCCALTTQHCRTTDVKAPHLCTAFMS